MVVQIINQLDQSISSLILSFQSPLIDSLMKLITNIGDEITIALFSLILFVFLLSKKKYKKLTLSLIGIIGGFFSTWLLKIVFQRPRPPNPLIEVSAYSMPSGHATMSIIFFTLLIIFFKDEIKNKALKQIFIFLNIFIILLIGFSRIYLRAHWVSDVFVGYLLGILWIYILIKIQKYFKFH